MSNAMQVTPGHSRIMPAVVHMRAAVRRGLHGRLGEARGKMSTGNEILLTQAAIDGELDAAGMLDFENRLAGNASLVAEYGRLKTLREVVRRELVKPVAPQALRERVARMVAPSTAPRVARAAPRWQAMAASAVFAAGLGSASTWLALRASVQDTNLADTLIADHKRGLFLASPSMSRLPIVTRSNHGSRRASRWRQRWWTSRRKVFLSPAAGSTSSRARPRRY
jgi:hypothetical protein